LQLGGCPFLAETRASVGYFTFSQVTPIYDDFAWTRLTPPPLTVIAQPVYDMGVAAATALIQHMEGRKAPTAIPDFKAKLIRRGSVGTPLD
jgi:DNA-binding LacI/PurR family transcriptional regulator